MKKMLLAPAAALLMLAACGDKKEGGVSATTKKNLEVNAAIAKCFETKDFSKLGDYLSEEFVDYAGEAGPVKGVAANKAAFEKMSAAYDSSKTTIIRAMGDDEYVMALMEFSGVMKMDMMGMKAGQSFKTKAIEVTQFKDGKAIAHWTYMEPAEMMKMMGGTPPPPPPMEEGKEGGEKGNGKM